MLARVFFFLKGTFMCLTGELNTLTTNTAPGSSRGEVKGCSRTLKADSQTGDVHHLSQLLMQARKCGKETPEKESKKCLLLTPSLLHSQRAALTHGGDLTNEPSRSPLRASQDGLSPTIGSKGFKRAGRCKALLRPGDQKVIEQMEEMLWRGSLHIICCNDDC